MIKKRSRSLLSLLLSLVMLLTLVATPVYAAETDGSTAETIVVASTDETTEESEETQDATVDENGESEEAEDVLTDTSEGAAEESEEQTEDVIVGTSASDDESGEEISDDGIAVIGVEEETETSDGTEAISSGVAQIGDDTYDTLAAAVTEATSGDTITLLQDTELTASLTISTNLTLDLNGHAITAGSYTISSAKNTDLTVKNGSITGTANGVLTKTTVGSLTLESVNITCTSSSASYYALKVGTSGNVINFSATNCTFTGSTKASGVYLSCSKNITDGSQFTLTNCTVSAVSYGVNILGGDSSNNVVISNCDISNTGTSYGALYLSSGVAGIVNVTDTKITSSGTAVFINYGAGAVTLELGDGNTVSGKVNLGQLASSNTVSYTVKVTGGCYSYTVDGTETIPFVDGNTTNSLGITENTTITGGYYKVDVSSLLPAGYECVANTSEAAGDDYNSTYANSGYTYVVQEESDVDTFYTLNEDGSVSGYYTSLTGEDGAIAKASGTIYVRENYTLTSDDLTALALSSAVLATATGCTLSYSGTLSELLSAMGTSASLSSATIACSDITLQDVSTSAGKLTGGSGFTSSDYESYAELLASGYLFSASSNYVIQPESSFAAKNDRNYLGYDTVQGALNSVYRYSGSTITVLKSVTESLSLVLESDFTLDLNGCTITAGSAGYGFLVVYSTSSNPDGSNITIKNGSITGTEYGITTNGTLTDITLTLEDVTITATADDSVTVYLAAGGETTISGCTIIGGTGVQLCGGSLTIEDSETNTTTITATGEDTSATKTGDGGICDGAAVSVIERDGYQALGDVTITGGTYTAANNDAVLAYNWSSDASSDWSSTDCTIYISGGTYSSDVNDYTTSTTAAVATTGESGNVVYEVVETVEGAVALVYDADGNYTKSYTTLTLAAYAVTDGGTVVLVSDVTEMTMTYNRSGISATLDLNGHSITNSTSTTYPGSGIYVQSGTLTVEDSVGTGTVTAAKQGPVLVTGGTLIINNGTYRNIAQYGASLKVNGENAVATVNGGTFNSVSYAINATQGTLTINDGYFNGRVAMDDVVVAGSVVVFVDVSTYAPTINITGGYFTLGSPADNGNLIVYVKVGSSGKSESDSNGVTITGGYYGITDAYKEYSVNRYLVSGYSLADNEDTETSATYPKIVEAATFSVGYYEDGVFVVTGGYSDIDSAAATTAATALLEKEGITEAYVVLNEDFTTDNSYNRGIVIAANANVILDLNGHSVTSTNSVSAITVSAGGTVTIIDSVGGAVVSSNVGQAGVIRNAGGTLTIEGGAYENTNTADTYTFVIYNAAAYGDSTTSSATTTVNGGTFATDGNIFGVTLGSVSVTGGYYSGTFTGTTTAPTVTGGYFTADPSGYTETGYLAVSTSETVDEVTYAYTVVEVLLGASADTTTTTEVPAVSISGYGTSTLYVGVSGSEIGTYSTSNYPTTSLTFTDEDGNEHTYIFAGWYEDNAGTTACTSVPATDAYAKFVDADVLSVICVFTPSSVTGSGNFWRFISSTSAASDSMEIVVSSGGTTLATIAESSLKRYSTSYRLSSINTTFTPGTFSDASKYVVTGSYTDSDSTSTSVSVTAYLITSDGTKVAGETCTFAISGSETVTTKLSADSSES